MFSSKRRKVELANEACLSRLRALLENDKIWLFNDPKLNALLDRYISALESDQTHTPEDITLFRARVGAKPYAVNDFFVRETPHTDSETEHYLQGLA